jgi:hypothetical protein
LIKKRGSTRKKTNAKMVNNEELQADVTCCRDEVNSVRYCLDNIGKGKREQRGKINKLIEDIQKVLGEKIDKLIEDSKKRWPHLIRMRNNDKDEA